MYLAHLGQLMQQRKQADADSSYVASLYKKGLNKILKKSAKKALKPLLLPKIMPFSRHRNI
jgi:phosphoribosyl-ATP pyrophosphohydrolase/phosphoribosyl-AMP cyclohydrolase